MREWNRTSTRGPLSGFLPPVISGEPAHSYSLSSAAIEQTRSAVWPIALALIVGLLVGFAGGTRSSSFASGQQSANPLPPSRLHLLRLPRPLRRHASVTLFATAYCQDVSTAGGARAARARRSAPRVGESARASAGSSAKGCGRRARRAFDRSCERAIDAYGERVSASTDATSA